MPISRAKILNGIWTRNVPASWHWRTAIRKNVLADDRLQECHFISDSSRIIIPAAALREAVVGGPAYDNDQIWGPFTLDPIGATLSGMPIDLQYIAGPIPPRVASTTSLNEEARQRVVCEIWARRGQQAFRDTLISAYDGRCVFTHSQTIDVLEAAHIVPVADDGQHTIDNGLLLRSDVHTLFDLLLISVESSSLQIVLSPVLRDSEYKRLAGKQIPNGKNVNAAALRESLANHYGRFTANLPGSVG
ncbi:MAG: HNH endonuclease [Candidatus Competibacteraceae bacterium]